MDQPQVDPKGEGEGSTESNYPDKHGYEEMSTGAFAVRMGQGKNKNSASRLARFLLFFCQSQLAGIIRAHPSNPWSNPASLKSEKLPLCSLTRSLPPGRPSGQPLVALPQRLPSLFGCVLCGKNLCSNPA